MLIGPLWVHCRGVACPVFNSIQKVSNSIQTNRSNMHASWGSNLSQFESAVNKVLYTSTEWTVLPDGKLRYKARASSIIFAFPSKLKMMEKLRESRRHGLWRRIHWKNDKACTNNLSSPKTFNTRLPSTTEILCVNSTRQSSREWFWGKLFAMCRISLTGSESSAFWVKNDELSIPDTLCDEVSGTPIFCGRATTGLLPSMLCVDEKADSSGMDLCLGTRWVTASRAVTWFPLLAFFPEFCFLQFHTLPSVALTRFPVRVSRNLFSKSLSSSAPVPAESNAI